MSRYMRNLAAFCLALLVTVVVAIMMSGCTTKERTVEDLITKPTPPPKLCAAAADIKCPRGTYPEVTLHGNCVWQYKCIKRL